MTERNGGFGGFGRGERTVIRPNPGARLGPAGAQPSAPTAPAPASPPSPAPYAFSPPSAPPTSPAPYGVPPSAPGFGGAAAFPVSGAPYQPPSAYDPSPANPYPVSGAPYPPPPPVAPPQHAVPGATPAPEEWIQSSVAPAQSQAAARPIDLRLDELAAPHENPIMRAAGPLLLLLGRLRVALMRASFATLMDQVAGAITFFEKDIRSAGIPEQQANTAKYILCATADDIVQNIPTEDRHVWTQYSMLARFFGERIGGVRFFEELERALKDPLTNYPLLELQHACLALGFQGLHRTTPNGQSTLQQIQRNLYETLRRIRPKVVRDLSVRWQGQKLATRASRLRVPVWAVASGAGALLLAIFLTLRALLSGGAEAVAAETKLLHPSDKVEVARAAIVPPPPPAPAPVDRVTQANRIRKALEPEIASGKLSVAQSGNTIIIRVGDLILFESGQATVREQFKPVAARLAEILNGESGSIKVVGHTDNVPIKSARFPSNWHLSVERAKAVAAVLKRSISRPERIETDGKGSDDPIAPNDAAGRAKNRRVEVMIPRTQ